MLKIQTIFMTSKKLFDLAYTTGSSDLTTNIASFTTTLKDAIVESDNETELLSTMKEIESLLIMMETSQNDDTGDE